MIFGKYTGRLLLLPLLMLLVFNIASGDKSEDIGSSFIDSFSSLSNSNYLTDINSLPGIKPPIGSGIELIMSENVQFAVSNWGAYGLTWYDMDNYGFYYNISDMKAPDHYAGYYALTDSPGAPYSDVDPDDPNGFEIECGLTSPITIPSGNSNVTMNFQAHWDIERYFDGVQVLISDNGGSSWSELVFPDMVQCQQSGGKQQAGSYYYEGTKGGYMNYHYQEVSLNDYIGDDILFKFWFGADEQDPIEQDHDGFYVDDLYIEGNVSGTIFREDFETGLGSLIWFADDPWDQTVSTAQVGNLCYFGQLLVGINSSYVVKDNYLDMSEDDWEPISDWISGPAQYCYFENTRNTGLAELEVYEVCYSESNSSYISSEDYIIVDAFIKNVGSSTLTNIYPGFQFDLQVVIPPNYNVYNDIIDENYSSSAPMLYLYDDGDSDNVCVGVAYLGAGLVDGGDFDDPLYSAKPSQVTTTYYFLDDATIWNELSTPGLDSPPTTPYNYGFIMGTEVDSLPVNQWYRLTFAIIGGDNVQNLIYNSNTAYLDYLGLPTAPIEYNIQPTSLGHIKSMFSE